MKKLSIILIAVICFQFLNAQQLEDNHWFFGYYNNNPDTSDKYGITEATFNEGSIKIQQNTILTNSFMRTQSSLANPLGNLLFYTNGYHLFNQIGIMEGGNQLFDGYPSGNPFYQYIASIPRPNTTNKHLVFYQNNKDAGFDIVGTGFYFSEIDMSQNNGLGKVIIKKHIILEDTTWLGHVLPIKHANGRDWWILMNEVYSNKFYRILVAPDTVEVVGSQIVGDTIYSGAGQCIYSPDGKMFCSFKGLSSTLGGNLDIYDFDRCSGLLVNHQFKHFVVPYGAISISPNSKYLYFNNGQNTYQFDLTANDIFGSQKFLAHWDGTLNQSGGSTGFNIMQLAPDGKIYSNTISSSQYLHVIHKPDEVGLSCQFQQHGIVLPTYNDFTMPNFPNFRLGPIDGSSCDTLGLDNLPQAWFRNEQDTSDNLNIFFHDLSYYEPTDWSWNFDDNSIGSIERHPTHQFQNNGVYNVCLTVSNQNSSDTFCRKLYLGVSAQDNPDLKAQIEVSPNPFDSHIFVSTGLNLPKPIFTLYNQFGQLVLQQQTQIGVNEIETEFIKSGIYFWEFSIAGERVKIGKLVKI